MQQGCEPATESADADIVGPWSSLLVQRELAFDERAAEQFEGTATEDAETDGREEEAFTYDT